MFTGIVQDVGSVAETGPWGISVASRLEGLSVGGSVAVNGVCLTVVWHEGGVFRAQISEETFSRTTLALLGPGSMVNLERPVAAGGELGGHVVQGHVDGVGTVRAVEAKQDSAAMVVDAAPELMRYVAEKGSVALDGVSLTVASLDGPGFSVSLVPHTMKATNLGERAPGDRVNIEVDILAKYVERLMKTGGFGL